jgi:hypothetical protein
MLLYIFVYLYPVKIPREDIMTKMREQIDIPSNGHGHMKNINAYEPHLMEIRLHFNNRAILIII